MDAVADGEGASVGGGVAGVGVDGGVGVGGGVAAVTMTSPCMTLYPWTLQK
jgi:hypothetical protein